MTMKSCNRQRRRRRRRRMLLLLLLLLLPHLTPNSCFLRYAVAVAVLVLAVRRRRRRRYRPRPAIPSRLQSKLGQTLQRSIHIIMQ